MHLEFSKLSFVGIFLAAILSQFTSSLLFGSKFQAAFLGQLISMTVLATLMNSLQTKTIGDAIKLAILVWLGFTATVLFNESHWGDEKAQTFLLHHISYLVRSVVMAAAYSYLSF